MVSAGIARGNGSTVRMWFRLLGMPQQHSNGRGSTGGGTPRSAATMQAELAEQRIAGCKRHIGDCTRIQSALLALRWNLVIFSNPARSWSHPVSLRLAP